VAFYQPFNFNPYNVFQTPFQRYNLFSAGHYDITDHLTVYGRGMFSQNSVKSIVAPSGVFDTTLTIPVSNPFLTTAQRTFFCNNSIDLNPLPPVVDADGNVINANVTRPTAAQCTAAGAATDPNDPNFLTFDVGVRRRAVRKEVRASATSRHARGISVPVSAATSPTRSASMCSARAESPTASSRPQATG
jgi:iron complex outermembrane receptor protein